MVKYLEEKHGCDPKSKDTNGDTPLNVAAFSGSIDILIYLIQARRLVINWGGSLIIKPGTIIIDKTT